MTSTASPPMLAASDSAVRSPPCERMLSNQQSLPRLPVPALDDTLRRWLESCRPLASDEEMRDAEAVAGRFRDGLGKTLQARLIAHDEALARANDRSNWLEKWWYTHAYHGWRDPLMINVNWHMYEMGHPARHRIGTVDPMRRAALIIDGSWGAIEAVAREEIEVERIAGRPMCMEQYQRVFCTTRVPERPQDRLVFAPRSTTITVMVNAHVFTLDCYHGSPADGGPLERRRRSPAELHASLCEVAARGRAMDPGAPIGALTAGHRDVWSDEYAHLRALDARNAAAFDAIEGSAFVVAVEETAPHDADELVQYVQHNFGAAANRWLDKSVCFLVFRNGLIGVIGEHSPSEAIIPGRVMDKRVWGTESYESYAALPATPSSPPEAARARHLPFVVDERTRAALARAERANYESAHATNTRMLFMRTHGNRWMRKVAGVSPDAYVQQAIQLAWYKLYRRPVATYETATTRFFFAGRTETVRACTSRSLEFTRTMEDASASVEAKRAALKASINYHLQLMKDAMMGQGVDRHLLGLYCCYDAERDGVPEFFAHPLVERSRRYALSTSNISPFDNFAGGFGAMYPDGYGVCYMIAPDEIKLSVSSSRHTEGVDTSRMMTALQQSFDDMFALFADGRPRL